MDLLEGTEVMNIDPLYSIKRDRAKLGRLAISAPVLGTLVLYLWYFTGVHDLLRHSDIVRWMLVPLSWFLLIISPLLALAWLKNDGPSLMLTETALFFRPRLWSIQYRGIRREAVRKVFIVSMNVHGTEAGQTLLIGVDGAVPAIGAPDLKTRINNALGRRLLKNDVAISCFGWSVSPEEVKARIESWAANR